MEDIKHSFDELLSHSLMLFRQHQFYDNCQELEEEALFELHAARQLMKETGNCLDMAKWGCTLECLTQKFYVNLNSEEFLNEVDATLIAYWKKNETSDLNAFWAYLWLGYYFLLRFRNRESRFQNRSKRAILDILLFLIGAFRRFKDNPKAHPFFSLFSAEAWGETVYWAELIHDAHISEKQSTTLLNLLYDVKKAQLSNQGSGQDALLQRILEFYCFS